jgi:cysteine desulfurase/selenocysteine lyase
MSIGKALRKDFPIFSRKINGHRLTYLDNAATSQKPKAVLQAISNYYSQHNANTARSVHTLATEATELYESARAKVAQFIGAQPEQIIFTRNTTEALNLLSYSLQSVLPSASSTDLSRPILLSPFEHHSNLVPWQQLAIRSKRKLQLLQPDATRALSVADLQTATIGSLSRQSHTSSIQPALFPFAHASNVLGTINDARALATYAHEQWDCPVVLDAAQSVPHLSINVRQLGADFVAFSGHKMLGPDIGVLYMANDWMERLPPFLTGGGQISRVHATSSTWVEGPAKFEAGTPDVASAVGLSAAIEYLHKVGLSNIAAHEKKLVKKTIGELSAIGDIKMYGPSATGPRVGVLSFSLKGVHPHDLGTILDRHGVAVRAGHHCAQPLMRHLGVPATARASFYLYNDTDDIEALMAGIKEAKKIFA